MNFQDRMLIIIQNLKEMIRGRDSVNVDDLYVYCGSPYNYRQSIQGLKKAGVIKVDGDRISFK